MALHHVAHIDKSLESEKNSLCGVLFTVFQFTKIRLNIVSPGLIQFI